MRLKCIGPCGETKDETEFPKHSGWTNRNGRHGWCGLCHGAKLAQRRRERLATEPGFRERRNEANREQYRAGGAETLARRAADTKRWRQRHPEQARLLKQQNYARLKAKVIAHLGARCVLCPWTDPRALQVDHPNGGGTQHRESMSATRYYNEVMRAPLGTYRLLCASCNFEHRLTLYTPSPERRKPNYYFNTRRRAIERLGCRCVAPGCDETKVTRLQLDHIESGGNADRKSASSQNRYYRDAAEGATPSLFQVLCANHNWIKKQETPAEKTGPKTPRKRAT